MNSSPSLAAVSPRAQDAFPRLILVADDFGCFDANPRVLMGLAWPLRPDVGDQDVRGWVTELARAGMLRLWADNGRWYAYFTGWYGPKGQRPRDEYDKKKSPHGSKRKTPKPPEEQDPVVIDIYAFPGGKPAGPATVSGFSAAAVPDAVAVAVPDAVPVKLPLPSEAAAAPDGAPRRKRIRSDEAPTDPRHAPLVAKLVATFLETRGAKYHFAGGRDAAAVTQLLALGADDEIERRFRSALACDDRYRRIDAIHELPGRVWNAHAQARAPPGAAAAPIAAQPPAGAGAFTGGYVNADSE